MHNAARPEGCITEDYIQSECLIVYSRYLTMTKTKLNHLDRHEVEEVNLPHWLSVFRKVGKPPLKQLSFEDWELPQLYVLKNCNEVEPFVE